MSSGSDTLPENYWQGKVLYFLDTVKEDLSVASESFYKGSVHDYILKYELVFR